MTVTESFLSSSFEDSHASHEDESSSRWADMLRAADNIAAAIAADLGIRPGCQTSLLSVLETCQRYGGLVFSVGTLDEARPGFHYWGLESESVIAVADCLPSRVKATVVVHELVHRLLYSDAYETFNEVQHQTNGWNRREFREQICRAVERRFVACGGGEFRGRHWDSSVPKDDDAISAAAAETSLLWTAKLVPTQEAR